MPNINILLILIFIFIPHITNATNKSSSSCECFHQTPCSTIEFVESTVTSLYEQTIKQDALITEEELRELYKSKIFPSVKEALTKRNMSVNNHSCDLSSAFTMIMLKSLGVNGAEFHDAGTHITVAVKTKDGKKIILDPTMAQFYKDGTEIDAKLINEGFIGTEEELMNLIITNIEHWNYYNALSALPKEYPSIFRREIETSKMSNDELYGIDGYVLPYIEMAMINYETENKQPGGLTYNSEKIVHHYNNPTEAGASNYKDAFDVLDGIK